VSALRFYGERGVLSPASVDQATGYRSYDEGRGVDACLIRDLRRVGLPLDAVREFLGAAPDRRAELLDQHTAQMAARLDTARRFAADLHDQLPQGASGMPVTIDSGSLAAALDQTLPAAGTDPARARPGSRRPRLGCASRRRCCLRRRSVATRGAHMASETRNRVRVSSAVCAADLDGERDPSP
jgi:DNA-binding transcriptional MerR regulator